MLNVGGTTVSCQLAQLTPKGRWVIHHLHFERNTKSQRQQMLSKNIYLQSMYIAERNHFLAQYQNAYTGDQW